LKLTEAFKQFTEEEFEERLDKFERIARSYTNAAPKSLYKVGKDTGTLHNSFFFNKKEAIFGWKASYSAYALSKYAGRYERNIITGRENLKKDWENLFD
jgi:hypothetical protein